MTAQVEAAAAGMGLMLAPPYAIPDDGRLQLVLPGFYAERAYWLAAPTDLYRLQRVRAVWNLLREHAESHQHLFMHAA
jgi:DNA-binding transcriptional LysR family regulator